MKTDMRMLLTMALALGALAPAGGVAAADPVLDESDRFFLDMATEACRSGDFPAFLWPFANSRVVRDRYTAPQVESGVEGRTERVATRAYLDRDAFPIAMMDYSYVTGESQRAFDAPGGGDPAKLVYVQVTFNPAQDERQRVDWVPGRFETGEGDGPGTLIEATGPGGHLLFYPTTECWQLVADVRNPGG